MNRRGFLQAVAAVLAAAAVPVASQGVLDVRRLRGIVGLMKARAIDGDYLAVMHPSTYTGFVSLCRRGQWMDAYREWRKLGKPGSDDPRSIADRYGRGLTGPLLSSTEYLKFDGEIGRYEGVRFIESPSPPLFQKKEARERPHWQRVLPARERRWM